jgi:hypothetical protein
MPTSNGQPLEVDISHVLHEEEPLSRIGPEEPRHGESFVKQVLSDEEVGIVFIHSLDLSAG